MMKTIHSYYLALVDARIKSFGNGHVMSRSSISKKLEKLVDSYWNDVYNKAHMKKAKHKNVKSI